MGRATTGAATDYNDDDSDRLVDLLEAAFDMHGGEPHSMTVTADIQWAGAYNNVSNRTTTLTGLTHSGRVKAAVAAAVAARQAAALLRPAPKSVGAQVRALQRTKEGRARWGAAGLDVSPRTVKRWLAGTQQPSAANRAKLQAATTQWQTEKSGRAAAAARKATDALSEMIRDRYETEVRLFNPSRIDFD